MNKKVLTLCAGFLLAGSSVAWGQNPYDASVSAGVSSSVVNDLYKINQVTDAFNQFYKDGSSMTSKSAFPNVSPFAITNANGAKPIQALEYAGTNKAEDKYFQFVVSETDDSDNAVAKHVLTMVFVDGQYKVQIENVENANFSDNPVKLDRTLWKVTAYKDAAGTTLYYELQNKATDAILQLSTTPISPVNDNDFYEVGLNIVAGQTDWRWAKGETASQNSVVKNEAGANQAVLVDALTAQFTNGVTLYLAQKKVDNKISLGAIVGNSNSSFTSETITYADESEATFTPIKFEAWEANPILLTAEQINAELGNDLYDDGKSDGQFKFTFDPDVVGNTNVMTASDFVAVAPLTGNTRKPGDAADHFVRFQKKNTNEFLMVDTTYYNEAAQDRYELQMAVREITFPRYAVITDNNGDIDAIAKLESAGTAYTTTTARDYVTNPLYSVAAYTQMKRQSNFLPVFYPATSSLKLQAEMIYKKSKTDEPWWMQVKKDIRTTDGVLIPANYYIDGSINPLATGTNGRINAVGYYFAANAVSTLSTTDQVQKLSYDNKYQIPDVSNQQDNKYKVQGYSATKSYWAAIPTLNVEITNTIHKVSSINGNSKDMHVIDPTSANQTESYSSTNKTQIIPSVNFLKSNSNVVKLVTLSSNEKFLSADIADPNDKVYNGLLTNISLAGLRQNSQLSEVVDIQEGFYYIQNANKKASQLNKYNDYRYEDLAATNAMFTYWNNVTEEWDRGVSDFDQNQDGSLDGLRNVSNAEKDNEGIHVDSHKNIDRANIGNLVYSSEKLTIPSAQWYIKGNGDHYTMINRESGRQWGTEYWWKTNEEDVYVNQATYTDAAGMLQTYRDTIRLTPVPAAELTDKHLGYLNLTQEEALADTTTYTVGMASLGEVRFSLSEVDGVLTMVQDAQGSYKLERALITDTDPYVSGNAAKKTTDELIYGFAPTVNGKIDSSKMLERAKYYIYKDEVSANSGIEPTSIKTRNYITLSEGEYRLTPVKVQFDDNLYSMNTEIDEVANTDGVKVRRAFYVKQMTADPNKFVLVDPAVVTTTQNGTSTKTAYGARVFVNQLTGELQPGSLISDGYANSFANSILDFDKVGKQNYADIRAIGADRDTVEFFVANAPTYKLGENSQIKGAKVGLLDLRAESADINTAIFVDTANVNNAACPRFLLGVRDYDKYETSNLDHHNRHLWTKAAYLVNLKDSVDVNPAYYYRNIDQNATTYYRLGFLDGTHKGTTLTLDNGKSFDLSDAALGENGLNIATFAFRYCDTSRENFYIETMYDDNTRGWICIHNGVAAVTKNIQEAEVFSMAQNENIATSNEAISAEEGAVSVVATDGAVIVKGAEGKNVVIATILGKVVANETVNSDNETIAVPAGIAVVSVDGESFKVVVK